MHSSRVQQQALHQRHSSAEPSKALRNEKALQTLYLQMALATLPDVDLLEVLSYLGPKELLRCRAVCRRWRSLALHPLLWRTKKLYAYWNEKPCRLVLAVLRHAPRLRYLCLGSGERSLDLCGGLLGLTNCAVSRLDIHCSEADAVLFALALSRQAVLGRLKEVSLTVGRMQPQQDESWRQRLDVLFDQLVYTRGFFFLLVCLLDWVQLSFRTRRTSSITFLIAEATGIRTCTCAQVPQVY